MIKLENIEVMGFEPALRGMRLPHNSGDKSDSGWKLLDEVERYIFEGEYTYNIGENDLKLARQLSKAGTDHSKYLRMITVYMDITAPLYLWKQMDQYKIGVTTNSTSTMHCIHNKEFTLDDFSCEHLSYDSLKIKIVDWVGSVDHALEVPAYLFDEVIGMLNACRQKYLETKDKKYWYSMIQLLPSSYNQKRTVMLNYQVLKNIYHARKSHKLPEWVCFCEEIKNLPYFEELCIDM